MSDQFDEKGKIFTNVVKKNSVSVQIQTVSHLIKGQYHIRPEERLRDELNRNDDFIAVTDADLYDSSGELINRCNFITVNRQHIVWVIKEDEIVKEGAES